MHVRNVGYTFQTGIFIRFKYRQQIKFLSTINRQYWKTRLFLCVRQCLVSSCSELLFQLLLMQKVLNFLHVCSHVSSNSPSLHCKGLLGIHRLIILVCIPNVTFYSDVFLSEFTICYALSTHVLHSMQMIDLSMSGTFL